MEAPLTGPQCWQDQETVSKTTVCCDQLLFRKGTHGAYSLSHRSEKALVLKDS